MDTTSSRTRRKTARRWYSSPEPQRTSDALTFVGTATSVLHLPPFRLMTDPNFLHRGQRAYLGGGLWTKRRTEPAMQPADLPELDAILLSHMHGDHFDRIARRELDHGLPVITNEHAAERLTKWGFTRAQALRPWQHVDLRRDGACLRITAIPGQHGPGFAARLLPPVIGMALHLHRPDRAPLSVYITGDVTYDLALAQVGQVAGHIDTMVMHLGGTRIGGVLITMDARQGAQLLRLLHPDSAIPVHYDDYRAFRSSLQDFIDEARRETPEVGVRVVRRGQAVPLGPVAEAPMTTRSRASGVADAPLAAQTGDGKHE
jgi:L-ascorbate metabolism protein UlaG (beta-lactamase superfamily)